MWKRRIVHCFACLAFDACHAVLGKRRTIKLVLQWLDREGDTMGFMRVRAAWHQVSGEWISR